MRDLIHASSVSRMMHLDEVGRTGVLVGTPRACWLITSAVSVGRSRVNRQPLRPCGESGGAGMTQTNSSPALGGGGDNRNAGSVEPRERLAPLLPGGEPIESLLRKAQSELLRAPPADAMDLAVVLCGRAGHEDGRRTLPSRWSACRCTRSTAPCRWSGTSPRRRRSPTSATRRGMTRTRLGRGHRR